MPVLGTKALFQVGDRPQTEGELRRPGAVGDRRGGPDHARRGRGRGAAGHDVCPIIGAGWPFGLGGITPYLDRSGIAESTTGGRFLPPEEATRDRYWCERQGTVL
jgi:hypothetical protein